MAGPRGEGGRGTPRAMAGIVLANSVHILPPAAGAPTNGVNGDGAGFAGPGSLYINTTSGDWYRNTNTAASPTWVVMST